MRETLVMRAREIERLSDRPLFLRAMASFDNELQGLLVTHKLKSRKITPRAELRSYHPMRKTWLRRQAEAVARVPEPSIAEVRRLRRRFEVVMSQFCVSSADLERLRTRCA